ncbi:MAG: HAD-IIIA family hydrolase [Chitinispirillia bacterium]|nr:HAD-IIIA family hydrolase [Chitinispirillia bacterium]MCL2241190.1 HAD-IIIA family hydrolase [Chitinispirillia bacterium]
MKTVIMAGGKGTRIAEVNPEVPKPMIEICGKPILLHQINVLKEQGFKDITLIIGHLGKIIEDYFGDGSNFGVDIKYIREDVPLGTAGALFYLKDEIRDDFLLINGDIIFDIDIKRFLDFHKKFGGMATIFTHPNNHPYDSGIIIAGDNHKVTGWLHKEDERKWYKNRVNAGLHILSPEVLAQFTEPRKTDLDRDILKKLINTGGLTCYDSPEYVRDMGTPDRYKQVTRDMDTGLVKKKNLSNKQEAVFIDRDGTINKYAGFLRDIDDFQLIDGVAEFIINANAAGKLVVVITNQPVIARGDISWGELSEIHNKMETLLGEKGAYVDDIFICPHHPDKGFEGERPEYKIDCACRKPKPGLLMLAAEKYNIDLAESIMIGDSDADIAAGEAAGCAAFKIRRDERWAETIPAKYTSTLRQ